jgi:hypothetical protein
LHCSEQYMALYHSDIHTYIYIYIYMLEKWHLFLVHSSTVCVHMHPLCWVPDTYARYQCHTEKVPVVMVHKSQDSQTRILFYIFFMLVLNKKLKFSVRPYHEGI